MESPKPMGGPQSAEPHAQTNQPSTPKRESQLPQSSPEKWNLRNLESGTNGKGKKSKILQAPTKPEKDETVTYPEGGVRARLVVFGSWCAIMNATGMANNSGAFQAYFIRHQLSSYDPGVVGWIFGIYSFLVVAGGVFVGPIFNTYGPRWLVLVGSIGFCLAMFLLGICKEYWQFLLVFGFSGGMGSGLIYSPAITTIGHYFQKKRGNAVGIELSSGAIGGIIFPLMLESLIPKVGFAWSTRVIRVIYVCAGVFSCTLIRPRLATACTISSLGYLTGVPLGGEFVYKEHRDYQGLIIFVGVGYVGAAIALIAARILQTRWKLRVVY